MNVPNMRVALSDCLVLLEKGITLNSSLVERCRIVDSSYMKGKTGASIALKNQNDNVMLMSCNVYIEESWSNIEKRSVGLMQRYNYPPSVKEVE